MVQLQANRIATFPRASKQLSSSEIDLNRRASSNKSVLTANGSPFPYLISDKSATLGRYRRLQKSYLKPLIGTGFSRVGPIDYFS